MLQRVQVYYDRQEDRLMLWLYTGEGQEAPRHALAITRRAWAQARASLQAMVDLSATGTTRAAPDQQAQSQTNHQVMQQQVPRSQTEPLPQQLPTQGALLVHGIKCGRRRHDGRWILVFSLPGDELTLALREPTMHAIVGALVKQEVRCQWGLPPLPISDTTKPAPVIQAGKLH